MLSKAMILLKKIMYNYIKNGNGFGDRFIELHLAKGKFINKPILIKLSSIEEVFDVTENKVIAQFATDDQQIKGSDAI